MMKSIHTFGRVACAVALGLAGSLAAGNAEALGRTAFVAITGNDLNDCTNPSSPCRSFSSAIAQVVAGGTIMCLGPGSFYALQINKSLTVDCRAGGGGHNADTVVVDAPSAIVRVSHLSIAPDADHLTISIVNAATVYLDHLTINGGRVTAGIRDSRTGLGSKLFISDSTVRDNPAGGLYIGYAGTTSGVIAALDNVRLENNSIGLTVGNGASTMIRRSVIAGSSTAGIEADPGTLIGINDTLIFNNVVGIDARGGSRVALSNSDINLNGKAFAGATVSYGNNRLFANKDIGTAPNPIGGASSEFGQR